MSDLELSHLAAQMSAYDKQVNKQTEVNYNSYTLGIYVHIITTHTLILVSRYPTGLLVTSSAAGTVLLPAELMGDPDSDMLL